MFRAMRSDDVGIVRRAGSHEGVGILDARVHEHILVESEPVMSRP
jgi:hypothetical protein